jgi:hypothetical protein
VNQLSVQQDLDQSPEEPKASICVESEEGKNRFIQPFILKFHAFYISVFIVLLCAFKFQELFET